MPADLNDLQVPSETKWCFGSLVLWEMQRRLQRGGRDVRLGSRALDLLLHLLKRPGEVVSKDELLASVWSGVVVEEGTVRVHMSILRKALGPPEPGDGCHDWIVTVPMRGYRFVGRVRRECAASGVAPTEPAALEQLAALVVQLLSALPRLPVLQDAHR